MLARAVAAAGVLLVPLVSVLELALALLSVLALAAVLGVAFCCDCRCRRPLSGAAPVAGVCVGAAVAATARMASSALPPLAKSCAIVSLSIDDISGFDAFLKRWMLSESPEPSPW